MRALKYHGGVAKADLKQPDLPALKTGLENLLKHIENLHAFGLPVIVSINVFGTDTRDKWQVTGIWRMVTGPRKWLR